MAKVKTADYPMRTAPPPVIFDPKAKEIKPKGKNYELTSPYLIPELKYEIPAGSILQERNDKYFKVILPDGYKCFVALGCNLVDKIIDKKDCAGR